MNHQFLHGNYRGSQPKDKPIPLRTIINQISEIEKVNQKQIKLELKLAGDAIFYRLYIRKAIATYKNFLMQNEHHIRVNQLIGTWEHHKHG